MTTLADRARMLEPLGFTPRQARFLVTVALHSGYCLRRQYATFAGIRNAKNVSAFLDGLVARRWADRFIRRADRGHVYHLRTRALYRLLGQDDNRNRRQGSAALVARKLMLLDYVLAHPDGEWFATEDDKVALCADRLGVPRSELPQHAFAPSHVGGAPTIRYFLQKYPVGWVGQPPAPHFVTLVTDDRGRAFAQFLSDHAALLRRLPASTVVAVAPKSCAGLPACHDVFARFLAGDSSSAGARTEELQWYLATRQAVDQGKWARLSVADLDRFRLLKSRFNSPEIESLYRERSPRLDGGLEAWRGVTERPIAANTCRLVTETLPYDYSQFGSLPGVA